MCKIDWNLVLQGFIAIGTVAVAVLAIWGSYFKYKWAPPKLMIMPHNLNGILVPLVNGKRAIYYHLSVKNSRSWSIAKNCHVVLRGLKKRVVNGTFQDIPMPVSYPFFWSPSELTAPVIDLSHCHTMDFGLVVENEDCFKPLLMSFPNNFEGFLKKDECIRYSLEIIADGIKMKRLQTFEVAWNGKWTSDLAVMRGNLIIREIFEQDLGNPDC